MPALTASLPGLRNTSTAGQDGARPSTLFSSVLQLCIEVLSCIYVPLLLKCLALSQGVARTAHELLSRFLTLPPCQVYPPRESAVVIVGGDDDIGRHLALTFSEQGCTVFALCPDQPASAPASPAQSSREAAQDASNVSALIQEWHKRIKRSGRSPRWGLLAPIVLDMNSGAQRAHAVETVDAYCATHNLHLVAVIVLPPSAPAPPQPQPLAGGAADVAAWAEVVRRCLVAPISVVHGYSKLLAAASGRVVLVLASGDQLEMRSAHLHALESAAQFLRREWGLLGIRVATVSAGPFAPASKQADDAAR
ncbi:uncharacterized protein TRAVEDRAFT_45314 [Trametes versicolor FP-101664 SS1]|uniref:uncharacterized protein n=1 Tax=Trametes versicolor (strain FP-101664) TaxID=717944 RepID=UPI00046228AF|nr:uncharacterized protein TRAVEDRAFT_45314 [Trametes versicolor FP-101664 SS1]EIW60062.1 hypothetical protein TRAVEDRAFT_45314 [Trametes versicolor FP-101664 SS1]